MIGNGGQPVIATPEGGQAYWIINDTGAPSIKGYVVEASSAVDNAVSLITDGDPDPMGVIYDDGVADGELMRIVFTGKAEVFFTGNVDRGTFARTFLAAEAGYVEGQALAEALPIPPFSGDKHFLELGHPLETIVGPGLALTNLHFN